MAVIALEKTWSTSVTAVNTGTSVERAQTQLYTIKTELLSNGFSVALSSNGTSSGASDYWSSASDVNWDADGDAHSWIVLEHSSGYQICFDCASNFFYNLYFYSSYSGVFTGGSTTTKPTATDELQSVSDASPVWTSTDAANRSVVFVSDSSNENYFILNVRPGSATYLLSNIMFGKPTGYDTNWTEPFYMRLHSTNFGYALGFDCRIDSTAVIAYALYPYRGSSNYLNSDPGSYYDDLQASKCYLVSGNRSEQRDLGYIPDLYWVDGTAIQNDYISDGVDTKRWLCLDPLAVPNDGTSITVNSSATPTEYDSADLIDMSTNVAVKADQATEDNEAVDVANQGMRAGKSDIRQASFFRLTSVGNGGIVTS